MSVGKILTGLFKKAGTKIQLAHSAYAKQICKAYKKNSVFRTVIKPLKPIRNLKKTYKQHKTEGKIRALKTTLKENGYGGPIGAVLGAGSGALVLAPFTTELGMGIGWYLGRGVEVGIRQTVKYAGKSASIFSKA